MKRRLILILLLSVVAAAILVWLYGVASDPASGRRRSSWDDIIADLDACARRKHIRALQYEHFADIAISEQRQEAERLFRALAFSERLQEQNCVKAIYAPFTDEDISCKMVEMLRPEGVTTTIEIVYQTLEGLHCACPEHHGDWYFEHVFKANQ